MAQTENRIRRFLREEIASNPDPVQRAVEACAVSRKTVNKHLSGLRQDGTVLQLGGARKRRFRLAPVASLVEEVSTDPALFSALLTRCDALLAGLSAKAVERSAFGIRELVNNAREHGGVESVRLLLLRADPLIEIAVSDSGPGLFAHLHGRGNFTGDREAASALHSGEHGIGRCLEAFDRAVWWSGTGLFGRGASGHPVFTTHGRERRGTTARLVFDSRAA